MNLDAPVSELKGIGKKTEELFHAVGVYTIRDILLYFPRDYISYPDIKDPADLAPGEHAAIYVHITRPPVVNTKSRLKTAILQIGGQAPSRFKAERCQAPSYGEVEKRQAPELRAIWFHQPYIRSVLKKGQDYILYGRVAEKNGILYLEQPLIHSPEQYMDLQKTVQPVYQLTKGLGNNTVKKAVDQALSDCVSDDETAALRDRLPEQIRQKYDLCGYAYAIQNIHFPVDVNACIEARRRLVFDEFLLFLLQMHLMKEQEEKTANHLNFTKESILTEIITRLPYQLTGAQRRAMEDVFADLRGPYTMQRLIQGDVGSGKTVIAFSAMLEISGQGYQSAIMAPTDVLARQHANKLTAFCEQMGVDAPVVLLTGSLKAAQKREALEIIRREKNALIVGTHALFQECVEYANLALVVTDEQHRFGVKQRAGLAEKGELPHYLVMSATPIPRTLAIILYGDLDISVIDEVPAMRLPIKNCVVDPTWRNNAYSFIEKQVAAGHQVYIVCPLVEPSEEMDGENVIEYTKKIRERFKGIATVGMLHGRMKPEEKNAVMEAFLQGETQILVSTTVIEVGVDVPNATVMMVENAERFGLAQLHQLRGRVGRGDAQSYCIFMQGKKANTENERLSILNRSNDGFEIAREDLKLRGPGDFFGIRQSGAFSFQLADVFQDMAMLQKASEEAKEILAADPELAAPEHYMLKKELHRMAEQNDSGERFHI